MGVSRFALLLMLPLATMAQAQSPENTPIEEGRADTGTSWKYFFFHKEGVSAEQARADIIQCYGYAENLIVPKQGSSPTYMSVPYGGTTGLSPLVAGLVGGAGGLAGAIVAGFMDAGERRAMERTNLRKCFGFKGYARYELSKKAYEELLDGEAEAVRAKLVALASGPVPAEERLIP